MDRVAIAELRRWCPIGETHQDADDVWCGWSNCFDHKASHRLRLRRMLVCSGCGQGYFTKQDFDIHECRDTT